MDDPRTIAEEDTEEMKSEDSLQAARIQLESGIKSGAGWFFFIAGLSLVNSLIILFSSWNRNFVVGLGMTRIIDSLAKGWGTPGIMVAFVLDVMIAGLFAVLGIFGRKSRLWPFISGMILYALDALLILVLNDFLGVLFHGIVLFYLFKGARLVSIAEKMERQSPSVKV